MAKTWAEFGNGAPERAIIVRADSRRCSQRENVSLFNIAFRAVGGIDLAGAFSSNARLHSTQTQ
jgi:hypothetical protein